MENKILIEKKYLIFREDAQKLAQKIKKMKNKKVFVDFSKVIFISRSFADELINKVHEFKEKGIKIEFLNLNPSLEKFISKIKKTKRKIQALLK